LAPGTVAPGIQDRFVGKVASQFPDAKPVPYGFLESEEFERRYTVPPSAPLISMSGMQIGDKVVFTTFLNARREPIARNLTKISDQYYDEMVNKGPGVSQSLGAMSEEDAKKFQAALRAGGREDRGDGARYGTLRAPHQR
jgi:hypothetical protein